MEALECLDLNTKQQSIYMYLLEHGPSTASDLGKSLGEQRTNIYLLSEKLVDMELVAKDDSTPITHLKITSPIRLQELLLEQQSKLAKNASRLKKQLPDFQGLYHLHTASEGLAYFTGVTGYRSTLDEQLRAGQDVCVISTAKVNDRPDLWDILQNSLQKRAIKKISTKMLLDPSLKSRVSVPELAQRRVQLRFWGNSPFQSEVALCGSSTILTTYDENLKSIVIKDRSITETFQVIFDTAWDSAE